MEGTGLKINNNWSIAPLKDYKNEKIKPSCKICNSRDTIRKIIIEKQGNPFGVFVCSDCLNKITILTQAEAMRNDVKMDYDWAKDNKYDFN